MNAFLRIAFFCLSLSASSLAQVVYTVTSAANSGTGSLRDIITTANASGNTSVRISFKIGTGDATIILTSALPTITAATVSIDAYNTTTIPSAEYKVIINGSNLPGPAFRYSNAVTYNNGPFSGTNRLSITNFTTATYVVTTNSDTGANSLRQIREYCEQTPALDKITFFISGQAPHTIALTSQLVFNAPITIDGSTQPANGYTGNMPKIELSGAGLKLGGLASEVYGLYFKNSAKLFLSSYARRYNSAAYPDNADNSIIGKSGAVNVFVYPSALEIQVSNNVIVQNNFFGMDVNGTLIGSQNYSGEAIKIFQTKGIRILNNSIGSYGRGLNLVMDTSTVVQANTIGINSSGVAVPNSTGIYLDYSVTAVVGGTVSTQANVISGNGTGVYFRDNVIRPSFKGNIIGTNKAITTAVPNAMGLDFFSGDSLIVIGGNLPGEGNIISGNGRGINMTSSYNIKIYGNKIGTSTNGTTIIANTVVGIFVGSWTTVEIGKTQSGYGNIIAGSPTAIAIQTGGNNVDNETQAIIRGNSLFNNTKAISNPVTTSYIPYIYAPTITSVSASNVTGKSAANATIDLYYHSGVGVYQGKTFFATVIADASGDWTYAGTIATPCMVTATATLSKTSHFSDRFIFGNLSGPPLEVCKGSSIQLIASGGSNYSWTPAGTLSNASIADPVAQPLVNTLYKVSLTNAIGCPGRDSIMVNVVTPSVLQLRADTSICEGDSIVLDAKLTNVTYAWSNGGTTKTIKVPGGFAYKVTVNNVCGEQSDTVIVSLNSECGKISGTVYVDANTDCNADGSEVKLSNRLVKILPGPLYTLSDVSGHYAINLPYGNYNAALVDQNKWQQQCTHGVGGYDVSLTHTTREVNNADFANAYLSENDGRIECASGTPVVGRSHTYVITFENTGDFTLSGEVHFTYDPVLSFVSSNVAFDEQADNLLTWNFANLVAGEHRSIFVTLNVPADFSLTNTELQTTAELQTDQSDSHTADNHFSLKKVILNSYDPNFKEVSPKGIAQEGYITTNDSILSYTIHFQNEGSAPAQDIVVTDSLSQFLNIESFEAGVSSHSCSIAVLKQNVIQWTFQNIQLPTKTADELASQGFFTFRIHQKKNNTSGTRIENKANIYFDFNPAIVTNTVHHTLWDPILTATTPAAHNEMELTAYPNPFKEKFTVSYKVKQTEKVVLQLMNLEGQNISTLTDEVKAPGNYAFTYNTVNKGVYLLKLSIGEQSTYSKIISY